jgi:glycosyltransferase involved in cell wall biosynthesis
MHKKPKISIITVVFNGESTLESTIKSIACQTYSNIEYIIVDGQSTDGTLKIIQQYESAISKWISEPDKGIYDAMNKGIKLASGDYIWFMNSGDKIADSNTLEQVMKSATDSDVYYGETLMIDDQGRQIGNRRLSTPEKLSWKSFKQGMLVSHQSFIVRKKIVCLYNLKYRFSADFEWCLLALKKASVVTNTHLILSHFLDGGITKQNIVPGLKERFKIMTEQYGLPSTLFHHIFIGIKFIVFLIRHKRF